MKTYFILINALFTANVIVAQNKPETHATGIYLTKEDFLSNNVYHLAKNDAENALKIGSNQSIILHEGPNREKFRFKDIYGYRFNGEQYRKFGAIKLFQKYGYAKVIADQSLKLYSAHYAVHKVGRTHYFYSKSANSPLRYLSKKNLRSDFSDNTKFLQSVKGMTYKEMISQKDGKYLILELFEKSLKK